jgi:hypothetical protein
MQVADSSQPSGFDIVATGSGTIDLTDLSFNTSARVDTGIGPSGGTIIIGTGSADIYNGTITGPPGFGTGGGTAAGGGTGDLVGLDNFDHQILVPAGYTSGLLSSTLPIPNTTLASFGATPGTYTWTWGSGAHADSFTVDVVAATVVPEPSTWAMMLVGFAALGFAGYRASRRSAQVA